MDIIEIAAAGIVAVTIVAPHGLTRLSDSSNDTARETEFLTKGLVLGQLSGFTTALLIYKLYLEY